MIAFLTSSPGGSQKEGEERFPAPFDERNGFLEKLKHNWRAGAKCLIVSADPEAGGRNDGMRDLFGQALAMSGLLAERVEIWDRRNQEQIGHLGAYDVLILGGGHVPTQNAFFHEIRLRERLAEFDGLLIGISAGTMNSARVVYAQPELEGESLEESYERFLPGLGLTDFMILPHYQQIRDAWLDGRRVMEEITYPDSLGRRFYALVDGSYLLLEGSDSVLYGEAYLIEDGRIRRICEEGQRLVLAHRGLQRRESARPAK